MGNRDRHDIVVEILTKASSGPCGKTYIMEKVGLSYGQIQQYLSELLNNGYWKQTHRVSSKPQRKESSSWKGVLNVSCLIGAQARAKDAIEKAC